MNCGIKCLPNSDLTNLHDLKSESQPSIGLEVVKSNRFDMNRRKCDLN